MRFPDQILYEFLVFPALASPLDCQVCRNLEYSILRVLGELHNHHIPVV
jgi:hypothetical protein